jgi:hypothetical protein
MKTITGKDKSSYGLGAVFRRLDEKRAQSKLPVPKAQKLGYAYIGRFE